MPSPRRSTRHDIPAPNTRATPRRLDRNPDLDPDDLRRTGSSGIMLLTIASVLVGVGVGFLIFPQVFFQKPSVPKVEKEPVTKGRQGMKGNKGKGGEEEPAIWRPDSSKLYPHENKQKAGKPPESAHEAPPPVENSPPSTPIMPPAGGEAPAKPETPGPE